MSESEKPIYILYGSQTGNAESISKTLFERCASSGLDCKLAALNTVKKIPLQTVSCAAIIVCSTTGNGDAPENADAFWRSIKLRSLAKDTYSGCKYAVLGLGDTNYDQFCHMGKSLDKRLHELGGERLLELACADEATNMEEVVTKWQNLIFDILMNLDVSNPDALVSLSSDGVTELSNQLEKFAVLDDKTYRIADGILSVHQTLSALSSDSARLDFAPPEESLPKTKSMDGLVEMLAQSSNSGGSFPASILPPPPGEWSAESPYEAKITHAKWLSKFVDEVTGSDIPEGKAGWGETKRVIHMDLDLGQSGIAYHPGDSIGICCPNPIPLVDFIIRRLNESLEPTRQVTKDQFVKTEKYGALSLYDLLAYKLDFVGVPKKTSIYALSSFCSDSRDANVLKWLISKTELGKVLWKHYIEDQRLGIAELLLHFPSCKPSLQCLASCLTPLAPRYYSIASSPLTRPETASIAFSVVRFVCGVSSPVDGNVISTIFRKGLCTSFLEGILSPFLESGETAKVDLYVKMFHKPSIQFRLPGSVNYPLILIGPGTGVSPFIGFLEHRAHLESERRGIDSKDAFDACTGTWRGCFEVSASELKRGNSAEQSSIEEFMRELIPGPVWLFFGCRNNDDYLYEEELDNFLRDGHLSVLETAMSRKTSEKQYVTHKIRERGEMLSYFILDGGAYVYICGDGNKMAKDVQAAIIEALVTHGNLKVAEAETFLQDMKLRRRLVLDIWS